MEDGEFPEPGGKKKGIPTWVYIAGGGGLLLLLMLKGGGSKSSMETDNLLAAEIDATLKAMQEKMEADEKQHREDEQDAWDAWKKSIEDLINQKQGNVEPPGNASPFPPAPVVPPDKNPNTLPPGGNNDLPPGNKNNPPREGDKNKGTGSLPYIPPQITGNMMDNYIMGFTLLKPKGGSHG